MSDNKNTTIEIKHALSGSVAKVHLFGATVISYVTGRDGVEHLFLSQEAKLDGSKAIRGGIPICFPIFGPAKDGTMPQHGFARLTAWEFQGLTTDKDNMSTTGTFVLEYAKDVTAAACGEGNDWAKDRAATDGTNVKLIYQVRVEAHELTTTLIIENTGTVSFAFNALLHTYLKVHTDVSDVKIHGLGGYGITNKVTGDKEQVQSYEDDVVISGEVDSIFVHPDGHPTLHAKVWTTPKQIVKVEGAGQVDDNVSPVSCVVWNPGPTKAAAMTDFGNDEYKQMVCVEPGLLGHQPLLAPGAQARLSQSILIEEPHPVPVEQPEEE